MLTATPLHDLMGIENLREQELEEARIFQGAILPSQPLRKHNTIISREFQPVTEVGGDYLDYFTLPDGTIGLYVVDVSGKGLPAALSAALAVGTLRGVHKTGMRPDAARHPRSSHGDSIRGFSIQKQAKWLFPAQVCLAQCCSEGRIAASFSLPAFPRAFSLASLMTNSPSCFSRVIPCSSAPIA
jgi:stage II sporulation SpoE-like protein